jgi:Heterokaryon incompatibility protein (HET)
MIMSIAAPPKDLNMLENPLEIDKTPLPCTYLPLNEDAQELRLLTILPGTFSSEIRVCLYTTSFTKDSGLEFEALSYTWGSPENPISILIGEVGSQIIKVTRNLAEALLYLRYQDKPRIIWIDAICVNQQDLEERSSQIKRMADIYSLASQVIVWLGLESQDSAAAIKCCQRISSHVKVYWALQTMSSLFAETHWADENIMLPFNEDQLIAVCKLLNREWFRRLWIWQEVRLAKSVIVTSPHPISV